MRDAARPGGVVAVEDLDTATLRAVPPAPALDRLAAVYAATVRRHGGDACIGPRLPAMLQAVMHQVRGTRPPDGRRQPSRLSR
jgi:hypothetical protein